MIRAGLSWLVDQVRIQRDPVAWARSQGVQVGERCRLLGLQRGTFGSEPYLVKLGDHVTVTGGVRFITHDGGVWVFREEHPDIDIIAPVIVGNNVFLGLNAILMPGSEIGDNTVIGAGSVVTGAIPPDTVAVGVPARPVRTREEYWERVKPNLLNIRSASREEKQRILGDHFKSKLS